jgi:hypothetical protein
MVERVKVVLSAAVTWIVAASAVVQIVADEVGAALPGHAEDVSTVAVRVVAVLAAAVGIIRRVSPVLPSERGLV